MNETTKYGIRTAGTFWVRRFNAGIGMVMLTQSADSAKKFASPADAIAWASAHSGRGWGLAKYTVQPVTTATPATQSLGQAVTAALRFQVA